MREPISLGKFTIVIDGEKYFGHPKMVTRIEQLDAELGAACEEIERLRAMIERWQDNAYDNQADG